VWRAPTPIAVALSGCVFSLAACGGGTKTHAIGNPDVSSAKVDAITHAEVGIFASENETRNIVGHPQAVAKAEELLKPLTVAKTLQVDPSNSAAGGFVQNLLDELDGTVPGLTSHDASGEHLNAPTVHRFLLYGRTHPTAVFHQQAATGVGQLERLLRGTPRNAHVTAQLETAGQLVTKGAQDTRPFWQDLSKRLTALNTSLR
jgi:hypothetical protein